MKVLLLNGSPHQNGCINTALEIMASVFKEEGIETEIFYMGTDCLPCKACYTCKKSKRCIIDDQVNQALDKMEKADGLVIGSPVHYASASGVAISFLDRFFFVGSSRHVFEHKPGTSIVSARRAGTTATLDQLNKYFSISQMPIISGRYWNMVHGSTPSDVLKDEEGCQNLKIVAQNFAWYLKCVEVAKKAGIEPPQQQNPIYTNFIRD